MTDCAVCLRQPSRVFLPNIATTTIAAIAAMTFSACGAAPTPLCQHGSLLATMFARAGKSAS